MLNIAKSFTLPRACFVAGAAVAVVLMSPAFVAQGATVTYTNSNCTSFATSGTAPNLTVTCVGSGGGGGGGMVAYSNSTCTSFTTSGTASNLTVTCATGGGGGGGGGGSCTMSASPPSPMSNNSTVITASCPGQPTSYTWTGQGCSTIKTASCTVTKPLSGSRTFTVTASTGAAGTITVTWQ